MYHLVQEKKEKENNSHAETGHRDYTGISARKFFATGKTLPISWRLEQLKKLRASMLRHEEDLYTALKSDLGKSRMESYMCEIGLTLSELTWMQKHLPKLMRCKTGSNSTGTLRRQKLFNRHPPTEPY